MRHLFLALLCAFKVGRIARRMAREDQQLERALALVGRAKLDAERVTALHATFEAELAAFYTWLGRPVPASTAGRPTRERSFAQYDLPDLQFTCVNCGYVFTLNAPHPDSTFNASGEPVCTDSEGCFNRATRAKASA